MNIALKDALGLTILGDIKQYYELFYKFEHDSMIDKLYKKCVRHADVSIIIDELNRCKSYLSSNEDKNKLNKLVNSLINSDEASTLCIEDYGEYVPIRIVIFDEPFCTISDNIPLEDYDNNDGEPFWMRPKYILEHYSKNNRK